MTIIRRHHRHESGFTLLEMSIVLAAAALMIVSTLTLLVSREEARKMKDTATKLEQIMQAIDKFVDENGFVPCPANGTNPVTHADFGYGRQSGGACTEENFTATSGNVVIGVVPTKTLGLSHEMMLDGWGRRITYAVDEDAVTTGGYNTFNDAASDFELVSMGDDPLPKPVVVLISHGKNGHGAFSARGVVTRISVTGIDDDDPEGENAHIVDDSSYDARFIQSPITPNFDDIVAARTKWQLDWPGDKD